MPKPDRTLAAFGRNVLQLRTHLGLSQEKLAAKAGVDRAFLSGIESGSHSPAILTVAKLAKALGVTAAKLMEDVEGALNIANFKEFEDSMLSRTLREWYLKQQDLLALLPPKPPGK